MKFVRSSESLGWCLLSILGNAQPFSSFAASDSGSLFSPGNLIRFVRRLPHDHAF